MRRFQNLRAAITKWKLGAFDGNAGSEKLQEGVRESNIGLTILMKV